MESKEETLSRSLQPVILPEKERLSEKKIKAKVKALYPYVVELQLQNGITRSPTYWELERLKAGGGTDGKERAGTVPGTERRDQGLT